VLRAQQRAQARHAHARSVGASLTQMSLSPSAHFFRGSLSLSLSLFLSLSLSSHSRPLCRPLSHARSLSLHSHSRASTDNWVHHCQPAGQLLNQISTTQSNNNCSIKYQLLKLLNICSKSQISTLNPKNSSSSKRGSCGQQKNLEPQPAALNAKYTTPKLCLIIIHSGTS